MKIFLYTITGGIGFITEVFIIYLMTAIYGLSFFYVRFISFPIAVFVTWVINRKITFTSKNRAAIELSKYLVIQTIGASINLLIYYLLIINFKTQNIHPILALAFAAFVSMIFTYQASNKLVFPKNSIMTDIHSSESEYSGHENLMVMKFANNYNDHLQNLIKPYSRLDGKAMDFGAGIGAFAGKSLSNFASLVCVEPDAFQQQLLKKTGFIVESNLENIENQSIDFIYSFNVLEHIEDDKHTVLQLIEKLAPGGIIFLYVPALQFLFSQMDNSVGHYRRYNKHSLKTLFDNQKLNIITIEFVDSIGVVATLLYKFFGNKNGKINLSALKTYDKYIFPLSRIVDRLLNKIIGKNIYLIAQKGL